MSSGALPLALVIGSGGLLFAQSDRTDLGDLLAEALRSSPEIAAAQKRYEASRQRPSQALSLIHI